MTGAVELAKLNALDTAIAAVIEIREGPPEGNVNERPA
jgi:hypothetical protein